MILFKDKYERAKKWQLEQKEKRDSGKLDMGYEVSPEDLIEKGDMLTILPIVFLILLIIALAGMAFLHIL